MTSDVCNISPNVKYVRYLHPNLSQVDIKDIKVLNVAFTSLQFGKFESHVYILDYHPQILTAAQAFAIALSAFSTHAKTSSVERLTVF